MIERTDVDGAARRDAALAMLGKKRAPYVRRARRALLERLLRHGTATADDVRAFVELPPDVNPKCFGAVPGPLVKAGIIERAGYAPTARREAHARHVAVWRLTDRDAALRWLAAHPDRPDDDQGDA